MSFIKQSLKRTCIYFVIFTILFVIFVKTLQYTLPFVIGIILASFTKANKYLQEEIKNIFWCCGYITTTIIYAILVVV